MAISYSKLGDTHSSLGNLQKALEFFELRSELGKQLYESYPSNVSFKNGLAISYEKLGETHSSLGNLQKALEFFEDETVLFEQLYESYPSNVSFKFGLAVSYSSLGDFYRDKMNDKIKAKPYYQKCYDLYEELVKDFPSYSKFQNNYDWAKRDLSSVE